MTGIKPGKVDLEDLLRDWRVRATFGDEQEKRDYTERLKAFVEDISTYDFKIQAYQRTDGTYHYSIIIGGENENKI